ncbi:tellurite resistance protein [Rubidibacter lacunae KORDI 51-2]|uniref:Tellurite resistance protein n=1 Tax=Rubidibacter lacunae KORDI 51-2 TaxID=582515 RepID=U5DIR9_9CHRO|nr:Mo-dependent nitrogenase C-terminal domain-containing protein [Rubidibacter lacunae]ERN40827.1 tellurite resistance protein [Rubidibacter lacunae KORDI 51-2]
MTTTSTTKPIYSNKQIATWLRGLLTIAWSDGDFAESEKAAIAELTQSQLAPTADLGDLNPISPEELATVFAGDRNLAENFMRTAVMVAIADGIYSQAEANILGQFGRALDLDMRALKSLEHTLCEAETGEPIGVAVQPGAGDGFGPGVSPHPHSDILNPVKDWLDGMEVHDPRVARFLAKMIPSQCPFERDVKLFGRKVVHIPPLCKLNPLYDQLVGLRFRALSYLADDCQEDVTPYL